MYRLKKVSQGLLMTLISFSALSHEGHDHGLGHIHSHWLSESALSLALIAVAVLVGLVVVKMQSANNPKMEDKE